MRCNFIEKLKRDDEHKSIAGVCSGLAMYFDVDVVLIRLIFILGTLSAYPFILLYLILWMITPKL